MKQILTDIVDDSAAAHGVEVVVGAEGFGFRKIPAAPRVRAGVVHNPLLNIKWLK